MLVALRLYEQFSLAVVTIVYQINNEFALKQIWFAMNYPGLLFKIKSGYDYIVLEPGIRLLILYDIIIVLLICNVKRHY